MAIYFISLFLFISVLPLFLTLLFSKKTLKLISMLCLNILNPISMASIQSNTPNLFFPFFTPPVSALQSLGAHIKKSAVTQKETNAIDQNNQPDKAIPLSEVKESKTISVPEVIFEIMISEESYFTDT